MAEQVIASKAIGSNNEGVMQITDDGSVIRFKIQAAYTSTYANQMPWGRRINGATSTSWYTTTYPTGAPLLTLAAYTITYDQTVYFYLGDTGTSGLGGPETLSATVQRATVPPAPTTPKILDVEANRVQVDIDSNGTGGSDIIRWEIGYGKVSTAPEAIHILPIGQSGIDWVDVSYKGTKYYFWGRGVNGVGTGPWSGRSSATTLIEPDPPGAVTFSNVDQTSLSASIADPADTGGAPILSRELAHNSTNTLTGATVISGAGVVQAVSSLPPGRDRYFWARVQNEVGWSSWSPVAKVTLIAGAYWNVDGVYKRAVPYRNVNGVWKRVRPWRRVLGVWKRTR